MEILESKDFAHFIKKIFYKDNVCRNGDKFAEKKTCNYLHFGTTGLLYLGQFIAS